MPISGEEIIYKYCNGLLNPNPDFYAGRGNNVRDLNSSILEDVYRGIAAEVSPAAAKMFVNMVKNLKNTNAQNFLLEYYRMEKKGWRWGEPVMKVRVAKDGSTAGAGAEAKEAAPAEQKAGPMRRMTEVLNAFTRSGSVYGHDKTVTQDFLASHKGEIDQSLTASSFGGASS